MLVKAVVVGITITRDALINQRGTNSLFVVQTYPSRRASPSTTTAKETRVAHRAAAKESPTLPHCQTLSGMLRASRVAPPSGRAASRRLRARCLTTSDKYGVNSTNCYFEIVVTNWVKTALIINIGIPTYHKLLLVFVGSCIILFYIMNSPEIFKISKWKISWYDIY